MPRARRRAVFLLHGLLGFTFRLPAHSCPFMTRTRSSANKPPKRRAAMEGSVDPFFHPHGDVPMHTPQWGMYVNTRPQQPQIQEDTSLEASRLHERYAEFGGDTGGYTKPTTFVPAVSPRTFMVESLFAGHTGPDMDPPSDYWTDAP